MLALASVALGDAKSVSLAMAMLLTSIALIPVLLSVWFPFIKINGCEDVLVGRSIYMAEQSPAVTLPFIRKFLEPKDDVPPA